MTSQLPRWEIAGFSVSLPILFISLIAAVLLQLVLSRLVSSKAQDSPSSFILLAGPRDAGKTSFLLYLQERSLIPTQTSTASATVKLPTNVLHQIDRDNGDEDTGSRQSFHLKDTPGHPKLRSQALESINLAQKSCKGIIFMLDSAVLSSQPRLTDTVEYLHELLLVIQKQWLSITSSSKMSLDPMPVLIACNKNDLFTALPSAKISSLLETELGRMKETKRKGLLDAGADEQDDEDLDAVLGDGNSDTFTWESLSDLGIEISVESGRIKNAAVGSWISWMSSCLDA
ncbi:hypothetical protein ABW21_db0204261 [Orbilia brochopaga]|nr:hypothetical protein ABW21_db0204261 [Drechslerella brochopaga]